MTKPSPEQQYFRSVFPILAGLSVDGGSKVRKFVSASDLRCVEAQMSSTVSLQWPSTFMMSTQIACRYRTGPLARTIPVPSFPG